MFRKLQTTILVLCAPILLFAALFVRRADAPLREYVTAQVTSADIEETILATGTLKPQKMVAVGAQVSGRVTSLKAAVGQVVAQGQLIAEIDPTTKENDLRSAEADLQNIIGQKMEKEAALGLAEASFARQKTTLSQSASSRADYDTAEANLRQTRAQLQSLEARIEAGRVAVSTARTNLSYTRIHAPVDGTILAVIAQEGQTVNAVQSAPTIVIIGQLETMLIRVEISEVDITKVRLGQSATFSVLGDPDRRYNATVEQIEPAPETVRNDSMFSSATGASGSASSSSSTSSAIYYVGVLRSPNSEGRLRTYMTAEVRIVIASERNVLVVPSSSLQHRNGDGTYEVATVAGDGTVTSRPVRIGIDNKLSAQVVSGVALGEVVIVRKKATTKADKSHVFPPPSVGPPSQ